MNKGVPADAVKLINELKPLVANAGSQIALGIPFTALSAALEATAYSNIKVAAQNCHFEDSGAFTGEISARMLAEMGVPYVIIGHSERREYFAETDETVNKKSKQPWPGVSGRSSAAASPSPSGNLAKRSP